MRADKLGIKAIDLVRKALLSESLDLLHSYYLRQDHDKLIIQLTARLKCLSQLHDLGLINPEHYLIEVNKIIIPIIEICYSIKFEGKKKENCVTLRPDCNNYCNIQIWNLIHYFDSSVLPNQLRTSIQSSSKPVGISKRDNVNYRFLIH